MAPPLQRALLSNSDSHSQGIAHQSKNEPLPLPWKSVKGSVWIKTTMTILPTYVELG